MKNKYIIEINDVYFVSQLLQNFNKNFKIFYNTHLKQYEIHDTSLLNSFIISYKRYPDEGLICKLYQTSKENISKTMKAIDDMNEKISTAKNSLICDTSKEKMKEVISFATKKGDGNLSSTQIKNILS